MVEFVLFVTVQWRTKLEDRDNAESLCKELVVIANEMGVSHSVGVCLQADRKIDSINLVISYLRDARIKALGWVDDDVNLETNCLALLVQNYLEQNCSGAVGGRKIGHSRPNRSSRIVTFVKKNTRPAANYPHGCCILVSWDVIKSGIPARYALKTVMCVLSFYIRITSPHSIT